MNTGMYNPFVRWWVVCSVTTIAVVTALFVGLGEFIANSDKTYLSWLILSLFFGTSALLGYKVYYHGSKADFSVVEYFIETCTALGLLGTIIGLIMMIVGAFSNLDVSNQGAMQEALASMSSGVGTALVTTLVGLISAILLRLQLTVAREKWGV